MYCLNYCNGVHCIWMSRVSARGWHAAMQRAQILHSRNWGEIHHKKNLLVFASSPCGAFFFGLEAVAPSQERRLARTTGAFVGAMILALKTLRHRLDHCRRTSLLDPLHRLHFRSPMALNLMGHFHQLSPESAEHPQFSQLFVHIPRS